jgi:hypothetical protein
MIYSKLTFFLLLLINNPLAGVIVSENQNQHHNARTDCATDSIKKQQESQKLHEQLYELESSLFYKKHLSPMNIIREKTAFLIAVTGLFGSMIAPFKMVKSNSGHPVTIIGTRLAVMATTLCASTTVACAVSFFRPILWYHEVQRDRLKKKIFELQGTK